MVVVCCCFLTFSTLCAPTTAANPTWGLRTGKQYMRHTYKHTIPHIYTAVTFQLATVDGGKDFPLNTLAQFQRDRGRKHFTDDMDYIAQKVNGHQASSAQIERDLGPRVDSFHSICTDSAPCDKIIQRRNSMFPCITSIGSPNNEQCPLQPVWNLEILSIEHYHQQYHVPNTEY